MTIELAFERRTRLPLGGICEDRRPRDRSSHRLLEVVHPLEVLARRDVHHAAVDLAGDAHEGFGLFLGSHDRRNRPPAVADMEAASITGKAERTAVERIGHYLLHARDLGVGGLTLVGVVAHHVEAHRRVADIAPEVDDRAAPRDGIEVLAVALEVPLDTSFERRQAHVLDLVERAQQRAPVLGTRRGDAVAAVAGNDRRDALPTRR